MASRKDRELDHEFRMRLVQAISLGWQQLLIFGAVTVTGICLYYSVRELAGRQTLADLHFSAIANLVANKYFGLILPWGFAGAAASWGYGERWLRKRHINRVSSESSELQKLVDPGRRSSHLNKSGETSREDF
jgi:hypothetical protein